MLPRSCKAIRRARRPSFALAAMVLLAALSQRGAEAAVLRCPGTSIAVEADAADDARAVCEGAALAIGFLARHGMRTDVAFELTVVGSLPAPIGASAFGGYVQNERRAYLLTSPRVAARGTVFGLAYDRTLYRALAVHEIAHAIAADNFSVPEPSLEAEEYIAYTAMFATMPEPQRRSILERSSAEMETGLELNAAVYLLDPFRFGVLSYRHFTGPNGGIAFLEQVLAGRALTEFAF